MLFELFILLEVVMVISFFIAFFTHQEILWGISFVIGGALAISSYAVEFIRYSFDAGLGAYTTEVVIQSYPWMGAINILFFSLALVLGLFDIFDKYGIKSKIFSHK